MLLGAIEIQLHISPASFIDGHDAERAMHRGIAESWPRSSTERCVARERSAAPPQTHTRVHTTVAQQELSLYALSLSLSLSPRIRPCMHASSICKFSLQNFVHFSRKGTAKNVVGEVDMPQRREAQRKFWSVWCVWHWSDCSWTLLPAAAISGLCQPPPHPPP